jgi:anti-anti-sigma factor
MPVEKWSDKVTIVHLGDDPQFSDDMDSVSALTPPPQNCVLDFSVVHHVNSSNIASLLRLRRQVSEKNGKLVLCNVGNQVWSTILITGLDNIFEFSENVTTALATIQMKAPNNR